MTPGSAGFAANRISASSASAMLTNPKFSDPSGMAMPPVDGRTVDLVDYRRVPVMKELPTDEKGSFISLLSCWQ